MSKLAFVQSLVIISLASGCTSETAKRTAYETLQNVHEQECLKDPAMDCGKRESYEDYERQRKSLEPPE
jgi:hypothetical protein